MFYNRKQNEEKEKWLLSIPCTAAEAELFVKLQGKQNMPAPTDANASAMQYYAAHRADFYALAEKFWRKKAEVSGAICRVKDRNCRVLLVMRYLQEKSWQEVADEMHISERHVYRLKKKALKELTVGTLTWNAS